MGKANELPRRPITNPYFRHLAGETRLCPLCGHKTRLNGTLTADAALEACTNPGCQWFQTRIAPDWASKDRGNAGGEKRGSGLKVLDGGME